MYHRKEDNKIKYTVIICEECQSKHETKLDEMFIERYRVRSYHPCFFCKSKTHWEYAGEIKSEKEFQKIEKKMKKIS